MTKPICLLSLLLLVVPKALARSSNEAPGRAPAARVLYDEAHGQRPLGTDLNEVARRLGLQVQPSTEPITAGALAGARLLFIRSPLKEFTASEKEAILTSVRQGTSLLLVLDEDRGQDRLVATGVNDLIEPFGMKLTPDTPYLHNCGGLAKAGEINPGDRQLPFSGGRAVLGGTPFAFQLDLAGKPAQPFAAWQALESGARIVVMGEAMASLFLGTPEGRRLTGVPRDFTRTTYWGQHSTPFMEEVLGWLAAPRALGIPMAAGSWKLGAGAALLEHKGVAALELPYRSEAVLEGITFANGTLEFDVEPTGSLGPAIAFRRRDADTYESFYLRAQPNCAEAWDCTQYAPYTHGTLLWDLFPQHQAPAALRPGEWNHVKLVASGRRMNVFVNGAVSPTLSVDRLEGDALEGGLALQGAGFVANLTIRPDAVFGLDPEAAPDPTATDARVVRHWQLAPRSAARPPAELGAAHRPAPSTVWRPLVAETGGLVNLSRQFGSPAERSLAWLRTTIRSATAQSQQVLLGWNDEVWVFVNGRLVYVDQNNYQPATARKAPDGRCSLQNGSFLLPLDAGDNQIEVAVASNRFGWGLMLRLEKLDGVQLANK